jgi:hypothetical protein
MMIKPPEINKDHTDFDIKMGLLSITVCEMQNIDIQAFLGRFCGFMD